MFVASAWDTVGGHGHVGRVYIYRLKWAEFSSSVEATLEATLEPDLAEVRNRHEHAIQAEYGSSLAVSRDGSTLAIAATKMNIIGAVYVYTRPDGPGQDWGDIRYEDGVKVTPVIVPSLGTSDATKPFTHTSTGRTSHHTDCDAYCSRVSSFLETNNRSQPRRNGDSLHRSLGRRASLGRAGEREEFQHANAGRELRAQRCNVLPR